MYLLTINNIDDILLESAFGISVVFIALALLVICFSLFGRFMKKSAKKKMKKDGVATPNDADFTHEEAAAISMALHLFLSDEHDEESNIITIKRIERRYSPWNSKIYGLTNIPR